MSELRQALRSLRHNSGFTSVVVLTLALGLGAHTAVFTVVNAVLLEPLPYADPDRLVAVLGTNNGAPTRFGNTSAPDVADLRAATVGVVEIGGVNEAVGTLLGVNDAATVTAGRITPGFFPALGVNAALGRLPVEAEYAKSAEPVAVLSYGAWQRRFGSDREALGRSIRWDDRPYTIVGVLEPNVLQFPSGNVELWVPLTSDDSRGSRNLITVARLTGPRDAAAPSFATIMRRLSEAYPESNAARGVRLEPLRDYVVEGVRSPLLLAWTATALVLVILVANTANMLLSRGVNRAAEMRVRAALGAGWWQLARLVVLEATVLVFLGCVAGLVVGRWLTELFLYLSPTPLPRQASIAFEGRVFAASALLAALTAGLVALLPLVETRAVRLGPAARDHRNEPATGRHRARNGLVVAQIGICSVMLVGAGLLLISLYRLQRERLGFAIRDRVSFGVALEASAYRPPEARVVLYERIASGLRALPGVERVGAISMMPLSGANLCDEYTASGEHVADQCAGLRAVNRDYFETMSIPLLEGRSFTGTDFRGAPPVALVNRSLVRRAWPDRSPLGQPIEILGRSATVVGVVDDVRQFGLAKRPAPEVYLPLDQDPLPFMTFVMETPLPLQAVVPAARRVVQTIDPNLPLRDVATLPQLLVRDVAPQRFRTALIAVFAAVALALALSGVAGVLGYVVAGKSREIGIRMAVGATRAVVLQSVLTQGLKLTTLGLALGLGSALGLARLLGAFLYGTTPHEPAVYLGVAVTFLVAAALAALVPARHAANVDPVVALKHE